MRHEALTKSIERAKAAAEASAEYKSETYLAVLLAELLKEAAVREFPPQESASSETPVVARSQRPYSAPEFFASKQCNSDPVKVVLAGYFLENYSSLEKFNVNDIRSCLVSAKMPLPKNIPLAVLKSVQRGWLMEVPDGKDSLKGYALTQTGQQYVVGLQKGE